MSLLSSIIKRSKVVRSKTLAKSPPIFEKANPNRPFSQRFSLSLNRLKYSPYISNGGKRRYYNVDRYQVEHYYMPRGSRHWLENHKRVLIVVLLASGAFLTVYFCNFMTMPYTKRKYLMVMAKRDGEYEYQRLKAYFKTRGNILPLEHPDSVRVGSIAKNVVDALKKELRNYYAWTCTTLDDGMTCDLTGLSWEVLVVDSPIVNAFCLPGGKIVVFTGLLKHFKTDDEIATVISHEVGHLVARHLVEVYVILWSIMSSIFLDLFTMPEIADKISSFCSRILFSRKMEIKADYIGLVLMASAGYDPQVAPKLYETYGSLLGLRKYIDTQPSGTKRARLLAEDRVMTEAINIYCGLTEADLYIYR